MDVISNGVTITTKNILMRLRSAFIWIITTSGSLLLKLPLASLRFLARIGSFLLDGKNRKVVVFVITTAAAIIASRALVNQANRKRLQRESNRLFSRFHTRFASRLNLDDADDDELLKAAWDLEQYLKARQLDSSFKASQRVPSSLRRLDSTKAALESLNQLDVCSERKPILKSERFSEIESTVSGQSHEVDLRRLTVATKALSSRPSLYQQTKYLDEIEEILKKRKRNRYSAAEKFLNKLQVKKSEALASNILEENLVQRQDQPGFEQTISESRQKILTMEHLEHISAQPKHMSRRMSELTEQDESSMYSQRSESEEATSCYNEARASYHPKYRAAASSLTAQEQMVDLQKVSGKSDHLFFNFFGMYTKESIKSQRQTSSTMLRSFNNRSIQLDKQSQDKQSSKK